MPEAVAISVEKLGILSVNRLADILQIPREKLDSLAFSPRTGYRPFLMAKQPRPFQKLPLSNPRPIDNPVGDLSWIQKRIHRKLLKPICFPEHICGAVPKRSVLHNADRHLASTLLVTLDVRQCFPSINNVHVYRVWSELLGCSPPVARTLTRLTTVNRCLPQGAATSPLLANLFIWMIDAPIRRLCDDLSVAYSTWLDDLAFSGDRARELIQPAIDVLARYGLRVKRNKIKIMGPSSTKTITGTRLGLLELRAPRDKISRVRSAIYKLQYGLVAKRDEENFIRGLVGQLRFIKQICRRDATVYASVLLKASNGKPIGAPSRDFLLTLK